MPDARSPALKITAPAGNGKGEGEGDIMSLARRLLRCASDEAPAALDGADEAVMLDMETDGVRCLLIAYAAEVHAQSALSPREQEIVRMVSQGYPNKTIAAVLDISTWTVSTHLRRIFAKLGVRTRAAMVARALALGLVSSQGRVRAPRGGGGGRPNRAPSAD